MHHVHLQHADHVLEPARHLQCKVVAGKREESRKHDLIRSDLISVNLGVVEGFDTVTLTLASRAVPFLGVFDAVFLVNTQSGESIDDIGWSRSLKKQKQTTSILSRSILFSSAKST